MSRSGRPGKPVDDVVARSQDFLPIAELMPGLTPEEVQRFVALGQSGRELLRAGDVPAAAARFRAQLGIFGANPEPYRSLAMLEAGRGSTDAALEHLREAVVRGLTDLKSVERAEAWSRMPRSPAYLKLVDAIPEIVKLERDWPPWNELVAGRPVDDLRGVQAGRARLLERVDAMAPALGPRLTRLWNRMIERATASMLLAYVEQHPEAPDLETALEQLTDLYTGGPLSRWQRLPAGAAEQLEDVATLILERFPEGRMRPRALVLRALARNAERDKRGDLTPGAVDAIRTSLAETIQRHPDSALLPTAVVGLVKTEIAAGQPGRAAGVYRGFMGADGRSADQCDRVREELGELALLVGGLPEFETTTLDARSVDPQTLRGKVAVVDFWATWCGPCLEELPALRRIHERHGDDVFLLGVSLDETEELSSQAFGEWIARERVPGSHVQDGLGWESALVRAFGVKEIPFNVVVDADGTVLAVNARGRELEKVVQRALRAASAR